MEQKKRKAFVPDKTYRRIADIDIVTDILARGFKLVILDIDGTLKNRLLRRAPRDVLHWANLCRTAGLYVALVSNDRRQRHINFAADTALPLIDAARKPSPAPFVFVAREFGVPPAQTLVIGNNPFTDVLGAHRAGMSGYLVRPIETTRERRYHANAANVAAATPSTRRRKKRFRNVE